MFLGPDCTQNSIAKQCFSCQDLKSSHGAETRLKISISFSYLYPIFKMNMKSWTGSWSIFNNGLELKPKSNNNKIINMLTGCMSLDTCNTRLQSVFLGQKILQEMVTQDSPKEKTFIETYFCMLNHKVEMQLEKKMKILIIL